MHQSHHRRRGAGRGAGRLAPARVAVAGLALAAMALAALALAALALGSRPVLGAAPAQQRAAAFRLALPGYAWQFPRDDGPHAQFANEWWYFTGHLAAASGRRYGFELTFFRVAPRPGAALNDDLYIAHFAISDLSGGAFFHHTRARRGTWSQAGIRMARPPQTPLTIWNENWQTTFDARGATALTAAWGGESLELRLTPEGPRMLNGIHGWSQKADGLGQASYYYSQPRLAATGEIRTSGRTAPVQGEVWMDHEFATDQLGAHQIGWNWMGLQLATRDAAPTQRLALLLYEMRRDDGQRDAHSSGTLRIGGAHGGDGGAVRDLRIGADGFRMTPLAWWRSRETGGRYPVSWQVDAPSQGLELQVSAELDDQEIAGASLGVDYWEGAVAVRGTWNKRPVAGQGYLEMTGYSHPFTPFH